MNLRFFFLAVNLAAAGFFSAISSGADWFRYRGPDLNGISKETGWQSEWPAQDPPVAWNAQVGKGYSSFVIADGLTYVTGHDGKKTDTLWCFDARTGDPKWQHSYPQALGAKFFPGGTTGTPTVDGDVVYQLAREGELFCLDAKTGAVKWQRNLKKDFGLKVPSWGFAGSPLVHGDLLLLNAGRAGLALNRADGAPVWKSGNEEASYSTAYPYRFDGAELAVFSNKKGFCGVEVATGRERWFVPWKTDWGVNAADPIISGDQMLISSGYNEGAALFKLTGDRPVEIWKSKELRTQMNPAVLVDGYLYAVEGDERRDAGLECVEWATGQARWREDAVGHGAVQVADGKLLGLTENGELFIAPVSPDAFAPTLRMQVLRPKCWTVPVLSNGFIYCRNDSGDVAVVDVRKK